MSYRFNNGRGAVTCEGCDIIIDEDLSIDEYKSEYVEPVYCARCKEEVDALFSPIIGHILGQECDV